MGLKATGNFITRPAESCLQWGILFPSQAHIIHQQGMRPGSNQTEDVIDSAPSRRTTVATLIILIIILKQSSNLPDQLMKLLNRTRIRSCNQI
jgi:hypothetical protein